MPVLKFRRSETGKFSSGRSRPPGSAAEDEEILEGRIGAALRDARDEKNLTVTEISKRLHIKESYLGAIERGEGAAYFPRSYLVGYMRSYARTLELDVAQDLELLSAELRREREEMVPEFRQPEPVNWIQRARSWLLAGGLALGGILLYGQSTEAPPAALAIDEPPVIAVPVPATAPNALPTAAVMTAGETLPSPAKPTALADAAAAPMEQAAPAAAEQIQVKRASEGAELAPASDDIGRSEPEEEVLSRTKLVARSVYLRAKPSNASAPVTTFSRCTRVTIADADAKSGWIEVENEAGTGYLYRTFLKDEIPSCPGAAASDPR